MENEQEQEQIVDKMWIYKILAYSEIERKGIEMECLNCHRLYKDNIDPDSKGIICPLCSMGLADGIYKPKEKSKKKRIFLNINKIDEKVKNRIS